MSNTWLELKANYFNDSVSLKNKKNMNSRFNKDSTTVGDGRQTNTRRENNQSWFSINIYICQKLMPII